MLIVDYFFDYYSTVWKRNLLEFKIAQIMTETFRSQQENKSINIRVYNTCP